ncbi:UNVERIFIED_CONTAM: hypothetical protein RMT77_001751 [Armadillidium vulgare]
MTLGTMNNTPDQEDLIQLEPLVHQVGGHSSMFVLDDVTVCKPLIGREYQFYRTLPPEMKRYTPEFRGSLQVVLREDRNGISMAALPNEQTISLRNTQGPFKNGRRKLRRVSSSSLDYDSSSSNDELPSGPHNPSSSSSRLGSVTYTTDGEPKNPWLAQCHQNHLHKLKQKSDSSNVVECIMLENLTFKFRYPCVLDLKMGTRQYGDDAPDSKRMSQTMKAANTTTVSLGVRLAGMQVYNKEKKCFVCKNKYFGRQLSEDSFKQTLRQFLHNGRKFQVETTDDIILKLKELRSIISKLDSFRFFTSSLLILYDSVESPFKMPRTEKDFERDAANVDRENYLPNERVTIDVSEKVLASRDRESWISPSSTLALSPTSNSGSAIVESHSSFKKNRRKPRQPQKPRVDIRLIDFAHATHSGMGDTITYKGPDDGILLGLDSLIKIFEDIRQTYDCEKC